MATRRLTQTALLTAFICLIAPWTLPLGTLPITLGSMAVALSASLCGYRGVAATAIYILLGAVGLPIFSGFSGGLHVLLGPTGGFIIGYLPMSLCIAAKGGLLGQMAGYVCLYLCGALCYSAATSTDFLLSLAICVLPFLIIDILKVISVQIITNRMKTYLKQVK